MPLPVAWGRGEERGIRREGGEGCAAERRRPPPRHPWAPPPLPLPALIARRGRRLPLERESGRRSAPLECMRPILAGSSLGGRSVSGLGSLCAWDTHRLLVVHRREEGEGSGWALGFVWRRQRRRRRGRRFNRQHGARDASTARREGESETPSSLLARLPSARASSRVGRSLDRARSRHFDSLLPSSPPLGGGWAPPSLGTQGSPWRPLLPAWRSCRRRARGGE